MTPRDVLTKLLDNKYDVKGGYATFYSDLENAHQIEQLPIQVKSEVSFLAFEQHPNDPEKICKVYGTYAKLAKLAFDHGFDLGCEVTKNSL